MKSTTPKPRASSTYCTTSRTWLWNREWRRSVRYLDIHFTGLRPHKMSIEFKPEWSVGMDGAAIVPIAVNDPTKPEEVGNCIDVALASVCHHADTTYEAWSHLNYVIKEL